MNKTELTAKEAAAIAAVKAAVKALPRSIYMDVDGFDGVASFWKRQRPGSAVEVSEALRCKSGLTGP